MSNLPPLPQPIGVTSFVTLGDIVDVDAYAAEQMRAYAIAARKELAVPILRLAWEWAHACSRHAGAEEITARQRALEKYLEGMQ